MGDVIGSIFITFIAGREFEGLSTGDSLLQNRFRFGECILKIIHGFTEHTASNTS